MNGDLTMRLEGALLYAEGRMFALADGSRPGGLPRAWFAYHDVAKRLKPLIHVAADAERYDDGRLLGEQAQGEKP